MTKMITLEALRTSVDWQDAREATVYDCFLVELPKIANRSGNITVLQYGDNCPFDVKRLFYLYDIPGGASRGGHGHRTLHQLIVAAGGSFEVLVDDGRNRRSIMLNRPYFGLHVVPGIWAQLHNFSSGSICLCLASDVYNEADYLRDYDSFARWKQGGDA